MGLVTGIALALLVGVAGAAPQPVGSDFRISSVGADGNADRGASTVAITYNPTANEYLVVWEGDGLDGLETDNEFEIFGQRLDANGAEIGGDFRISDVGPENEANRRASEPAVTYNPATNQYLVVWEGDDLVTDDRFEIFGQRLEANGAKAGGELRISNVTDVAASGDASDPALAYNPATNQYLVAWQDSRLATDGFEIFGQRLDADGTESGGDFPISNLPDVGANREADEPALAYNPATNQYLVVWGGNGLATNNQKAEIFGQRLEANGAESGEDFRISSTGTDGEQARGASDPALAYNPAASQYLVVWDGNGLAAERESEIFGQRLGGTGDKVGGDFRISNTGTDGDPERDAAEPALTYNPTTNQYLVVWSGDGLATDNEFEIFAQPLSADGAEIGAELRVSNAGTDGDPEREAFSPALASNPTANEYLVSWVGDGLATNEEYEIFGRRLAEPIPPSPPAGKCAGVAATKTGTAGADVIKGTPKRDVIAALGGKDTVRSLGGNDLVCGGAGNDRIFGGKGKDKLRGDGGADKLNGDGGADDLRGGKGRDVLKGGKGRDSIKGGPGKDILAGGPGKDREA